MFKQRLGPEGTIDCMQWIGTAHVGKRIDFCKDVHLYFAPAGTPPEGPVRAPNCWLSNSCNCCSLSISINKGTAMIMKVVIVIHKALQHIEILLGTGILYDRPKSKSNSTIEWKKGPQKLHRILSLLKASNKRDFCLPV